MTARALTLCHHCAALAGELHKEGCPDAKPLWTPPVSPNAAVSQTGNVPGSGNTGDQCEFCRAAPGQPHHPDCERFRFVPFHQLEQEPPVNVPLPLQERLLEAFLLDEWVEALHGFIDAHKDEIVDLAFQRLRDGYPEYRSNMFGFDTEERTRNALEEVADLVNYLSSGEVT